MVRGLAAAIGLTHTPMEPTEIRLPRRAVEPTHRGTVPLREIAGSAPDTAEKIVIDGRLTDRFFVSI
jgi:hypothetical protein